MPPRNSFFSNAIPDDSNLSSVLPDNILFVGSPEIRGSGILIHDNIGLSAAHVLKDGGGFDRQDLYVINGLNIDGGLNEEGFSIQDSSSNINPINLISETSEWSWRNVAFSVTNVQSDIEYFIADDSMEGISIQSQPLVVFNDPNDAQGTVSFIGYPDADDDDNPTTEPFFSQGAVSSGSADSFVVPAQRFDLEWGDTTRSNLTDLFESQLSRVLVSGIYADTPARFFTFNTRENDELYSLPGASGSGVFMNPDLDHIEIDGDFLMGVVSGTVRPSFLSDLATLISPIDRDLLYQELAETIHNTGTAADNPHNLLVATQSTGGEMRGTMLNEQLLGSPLDDLLEGVGGNNIFIPGAGNDTMIGGDGDDTFIIRDGFGSNVIRAGGGNNTLTIEDQPESELLGVSISGNNLILDLLTGDRITIEDYYAQGANGDLVSGSGFIENITVNGSVPGGLTVFPDAHADGDATEEIEEITSIRFEEIFVTPSVRLAEASLENLQSENTISDEPLSFSITVQNTTANTLLFPQPEIYVSINSEELQVLSIDTPVPGSIFGFSTGILPGGTSSGSGTVDFTSVRNESLNLSVGDEIEFFVGIRGSELDPVRLTAEDSQSASFTFLGAEDEPDDDDEETVEDAVDDSADVDLGEDESVTEASEGELEPEDPRIPADDEEPIIELDARLGDNIYSQIFFAYGFDEDGVPDIGVDILLDAPEIDDGAALVLTEDQDGFFDDHLDAFAQANGEVQLLESVFFYQEDDEGNLNEVIRLDAPEGGFQSVEEVLFAYLEAVEGAGQDLEQEDGADVDEFIEESPPERPDEIETEDDNEEQDRAVDSASESSGMSMELGAFAAMAFLLVFIMG